MAASQEQKVDFLLKKIGYVQSKTGIAEDASGISGTKKAPTEENKPSPLVVPSTSVWADSTFVPASPPTSNTTYVGIYTATNAFQLTHDNTVTGNRTFIARSTFGNQSASISGDWIDPSFGADYAVQVYKGDPNSGGVSLSPTGSGNSDEWFFDYSSGILNFNGTNVPSGITTSNVYLIGYKYLGAKGVLPPAGRSNLTTLSVSGLSTFTGNVDANGDLDVDGRTELDITNISETLNVVGIATFANNIDANGDLDVDGRTELDITNISETLNVTGIATFANNIDANGDLDVDGHTELDNLNVSGVSTFVGISTFGSNVTFSGESIRFTGANYSAVWNKSDSELEFADNAKVTFGAGSDLKIYHDGANSIIQDSGTGDLRIAGDVVKINNNNNSTTMLKATEGSSVELNFNNSKKFETTGIGVSVSNGVGLTATIAGPSNLIIDPGVVGDNTGIVRIKGDLFVDGTQTQINSTTIELADFIVGVATTATSDLLSDGAGIQIGPNNTFLYEFNGGTNPSLKSSENLNVASGKVYQIDQTERLSADTLSLGTGTTIHSPASNILTLGTNSVERVRITSSGLVGINENNPGHYIDMNIGTTNIGMKMTSTDPGAFIQFSDNNSTGDILCGTVDNSFKIDTNGTERFRITSDGDVGIGSEIPAGKLDVVGHTELDSVNVSGISTFTGAIDANGNLDVDGTTELDVLNVAETATFSANIDANGDLDVDGRTELDITNISETLNVTGITTFESNVNVGGGLSVTGNSYFVGVVTFAAGTDGNIVLGDAATDNVVFNADVNSNIIPNTNNAYDLGSSSQEWKDLYLNGIAYIDTLQVHEGSTFTGNIDANGDLDVDGRTELDITNISETLNVVGIATFASNVDLNADLDVDGHTELDNLNVSGVTTTNTLEVTSTSQFKNNTKHFDGKYANFGNDSDLQIVHDGNNAVIQNATGQFFIDNNSNGGDIFLRANDNVIVRVDGNNTVLTAQTGGIDVTGHIETDTLNVSGVSTFQSHVHLGDDDELRFGAGDDFKIYHDPNDARIENSNGDIKFKNTGSYFFFDEDGGETLASFINDGAANLFHGGSKKFETTNEGVLVSGGTTTGSLSVSGVSTFTGNVFFQSNVHLGDNDQLRFGDSNEFKLIHRSAGDSTITSSGAVYVGSTAKVNIASGYNTNFMARFTPGGSSELYHNYNKVFETTASGIDVTGHTETDTLNVSGLSTFAGNIDANGDLDVDGHTELDNLNVSGVSTFQNNVHLLDDDKLLLGGSSGTHDGLEIYHDGNHSYIDDSGTGNLYLRSGTLSIQNLAGSKTSAVFNSGGGQELYHNNSKKFETTNEGVLVSGGTTTGSLSVSGVSTFTGNIDANGDLDVDGHTELDQLRVSGVSTFQGNINLGDNDQIIIGDGPDLKIYHDESNSYVEDTGVGALIMKGSTIRFRSTTNENIINASQNGSVDLYYDNSLKFQTIGYGVTVFGTLQSQQLNVSGVSTFTGNIDANGDLDVDGHTELDNVNVAGFSTFAQLVDVNANLTVNQDLTVEGSVGIASLIPSAKLDVVGLTKLDDVNVSGASTFTGNIDANGNLDVDGQTDLDTLNVSDTATFTSNIDANGDLDVDGRTELDITNISETLNVVGITTFASNVDLNANLDISGNLDVDGHTELDNVNISGVVTATAFHTGAEGSAIRVTSNTISGPAEIVIDPAAVGDNTGALRIKGDLFVDGTQTQINSTTIEIADFIVGIATTATSDVLADGAGIQIGPNNTLLYDHTNTSLKSSENLNLASGKTYKINGTDVLSATTLGSAVVNSSLTNLGTLTALTVSGAIDANGDLDVDGHTELDNLNVSGVSTFGGGIDLNSSSTSLSDGVKVGRFIKGHSGQKLVISNQGDTGILLEGTASATLTVSANGIVFGSAPIKFYSSDWTVYNNPTITLAGSNNSANIVGNVGFGSAIPSEKLDVAGTIKTQQLNVTGVSTFSDNVIFDSTGSIQIPKGTTGQRSSGVLGQIRYNTSLSQFEGYGAGNAWGSLGGVKDVDGDTFVTAEASAGNDDDTLNFHTAGSIRVAISSTGQVGIGSTIPAATLDVIGDTRLTGILTVTNGIDGIGIQSEGTSITTGIVKTLNFVGSAISAITDTNGLVEIDLKGGTFSRSTTSFTATAGQTSFSLTYTPNFIDVYHNGVRLTASEFTATNGTSVVLTEGAFAGDTIDIVVFQNSALFNTSKWSLVDTTNESGDIFKDTNVGIGTAKPTDAAHASNTKILNVGVVTANNLYGALTGNVTGNVTGTADLASGLTGTPNITVGTINASTISVAGTITYDDVTNVDSVGIVTARTDVHVGAGLSVVGVSTFSSAIDVNAAANISGDLTIADKIVHDGDTNTAIRFPSADTFSIETAGTERVLVTSVSVGIGITNPENYSSAARALVVGDPTSYSGMTIRTTNTGDYPEGSLYFADGDSGQSASRGRIVYHHGDDALYFSTSSKEKLRIFSGGQVAIATATNYAHANADDLIIGDTGSDETGITIGSVNQGQIAFADSADNRAGLIHYQHTDDSMRFMTAGASNERLRITSAGNIGINSLVPVARVDLEGTLGLETTITTVSSTSATTIDTLPIATYRSAKFQIQVTQGTSYQTADLLVIHDGSIASSIEYASLSTSEELAVFTTTISGSNLLLQATMGSASSATVKVVRYGVTI